MSTPSRSFSPAALVAVLVVGAVLGWFGRGETSAPPGPSAPSAAPHPASRAAHDASPVPVGDAAQALDAALTAPAPVYQQRLHLAQAVAGLDRAEIVAALERERARPPSSGSERTLPTEALLARFAALDPAAATLWVAQNYPADRIEEEWLSVTLDTWVAADAKAALAWGRGLGAGSLRDRVNDELLEQMVALDPAGTVQRLIALGDKNSFSVSSIFTKLAEKDLTAACEQMSRLPAARMDGALEGIMEAWTRRQPAEAYAWAAQIPSGSLHDTAVKQFYDTWAEDDPAAAAAWLTAHGGPDVGKYVDSLAASWSKRDLASARAWSEALPPQMRRAAMSQVISTWTETDPRGATEYAMKLPPRQREGEISSTVVQWAKSDLTAAVAWLDRLEAGGVRRNALSSVCAVWADQDPRACLDYLSRQPEAEMTKQQRVQTLSTWAERAPEEVWQWSQGLTDEKRRGEATTAALTALAANDPAQAGARLAQLAPAAQQEAASEVASKWAEADPAAAARWAANVAEAGPRAEAVKAVATAWAEYDGKSAAAWLNGQPPGDVRDAGIESMAGGRPDGLEPAALMRLVQSVHDPEKRADVLQIAAANWLVQDRVKAERWIEQSHAFTPEQRTRLKILAEAESGDGEDPDAQTVVTP